MTPQLCIRFLAQNPVKKAIAFIVQPATVFSAVFDALIALHHVFMQVLTQLNIIARYVERMLAATKLG